MQKIKLSDIKAGDVLIADGGFTCLDEGQHVEVQADAENRLFVVCYAGRHYLDGQTSFVEEDVLVGLMPADGGNPADDAAE